MINITDALRLEADEIGECFRVPSFADSVDFQQWRDLMRKSADEIERLRAALEPFAIASEIATRALGPMADAGHVEAVAKNYVSLPDMQEAARTLGRTKPQQ